MPTFLTSQAHKASEVWFQKEATSQADAISQAEPTFQASKTCLECRNQRDSNAKCNNQEFSQE